VAARETCDQGESEKARVAAAKVRHQETAAMHAARQSARDLLAGLDRPRVTFCRIVRGQSFGTAEPDRQGVAMSEGVSDTVATFARIMGLIGKWLLFGVLILVALCACLAGAIYFYQWYSYDRHAAQVVMLISTEKKAYDDDKFPLSVLVANKSSKALERITFSLEARQKGRSTDLAKYHSYSETTSWTPTPDTGCVGPFLS
jgi:hypothetical protein